MRFCFSSNVEYVLMQLPVVSLKNIDLLSKTKLGDVLSVKTGFQPLLRADSAYRRANGNQSNSGTIVFIRRLSHIRKIPTC